MNKDNVVWVLRADAIFNFIAGLVSLFYISPVLAAIGWPDTTDGRIYASVMGGAIMALAIAVWFASNHPDTSREPILAGMIAKTLAGATIFYYIFVAGISLPSTWLLPAAVVVQVLFVLAEGSYLYANRS
jgi:hypothetical protein